HHLHGRGLRDPPLCLRPHRPLSRTTGRRGFRSILGARPHKLPGFGQDRFFSQGSLMNVMLRNGLVASSLVIFFLAGCSEDPEPVDDGSNAPSTTGTPSTGTAASSTSASVTVTSASATTTTGGGAYQCNPVTNAGCADGAACDLAADGNFVCFGPPNEQADCEPCDNGQGPFCMGTMSCNGGDGICRKYCCDDGDCAPSLTCQKGFEGFPDVGICMGAIGAGG